MFSLINFANFILIITFLIYLVLIFILLKKRNKISFYFSLVIFSVTLWIIFIFLSNTSVLDKNLLIFTRFAFIGPVSLGIFFLFFAENFPKKSINIPLPIKLLFIFFAIFLIFISFTELIVKYAYTDLYAGPHYVYGTYYPLVLIYTILVFGYSLVLLSKKYFKSSGSEKLQIKYIFAGTIVTLFIGIVTNLLLPILGYSDLGKFGPLSTIVFLTFTTYAITRYRLMDIRLVVFRSFTFGFIVFIVGGLFAIISTLLASLFADLVGIKSNIFSGVIITSLITIFYQPLRKLIERSTNTFLYKKTYDPDKLLTQISEVTSSILDLRNLLASIATTLGEAFHFQKIGIVLLNKDNKLEIFHKEGFKDGVAEQLIAFPNVVKILYQELKQMPGILVIDEMVTQFENGEFQPASPALLKALHDNDIALIIPLFVQENLIGVLALGNKKSGDTYNNQDINTLKIIGGQSAIAIENARLYDELKDFNVKLEEEVRRKTAELRKANANLKQLDKAKSEFISIASHQLRTPLTVIKGYISMMKEGSFGPVPEPIMQNLDKVYLSNERLIGLVENLLDISRIESGRQEFIWSKVDITAKAKEIIETLKNNAEQKGLKLILAKPEGNIPIIVADDAKLHEVMMNFIDNSIKYTKEGKIEVILRANPKGMVTFCVKDTGIGVSKDIQEKLFQKFTRGKDSFRIHTEGVGLGLYVAKMLIDAHKGKIWVDSEGEGKGSQFCFSVPVAGPGNVKVEEKAPVLTK